MTIDLVTILFSFVLGFPLGMLFGVVATHYLADKFAQKVFDSLLKLREAARADMEQYQAKGKANDDTPAKGKKRARASLSVAGEAASGSADGTERGVQLPR